MKLELWNDVERALDGRRSPFEDRALTARLAEDPEADAAARRLMERLGALERGAPTSRRRYAPALGAAAAALLVAFFGLRERSATDAPRALDIRLSVRSETYEPRLARITLTRERVVAWTGAEKQP